MSRRKAKAPKKLPPSGAILNCTELEYHADPCVRPSLSHSIAHELVSKSPLHAWAKHPKLGGSAREPFDPSSPQARGTVLHKLILGKGAEVVVAKFDNWRTDAAKAVRDQAIADRKLPVLEERFAELSRVAEFVRTAFRSIGYDLTGESEVPVQWTEESAEGPVLCRCRLDHLIVADGLILDVKSAADATPRRSSRIVVDYGYDIQDAAYRRAVEALRPELVGRVRFAFLFFEADSPYAVVPCELDGAFREIGERRWNQAKELWARCLARNHWPSYSTELAQLTPPPWVIAEHLGNWT